MKVKNLKRKKDILKYLKEFIEIDNLIPRNGNYINKKAYIRKLRKNNFFKGDGNWKKHFYFSFEFEKNIYTIDTKVYMKIYDWMYNKSILKNDKPIQIKTLKKVYDKISPTHSSDLITSDQIYKETPFVNVSFPRDYIISFGKYKGRDITGMLSDEEIQYCFWTYDNHFNDMTSEQMENDNKFRAFNWHVNRIREKGKEYCREHNGRLKFYY